MRTPNLDRREFLASGTLLAGAALLGVSATGCDTDRPVAPAAPRPPRTAVSPSGDLAEPPAFRSVGGTLLASITAGTASTTVDGRQALQPVTYNGIYPAPTLLVRPGDLIDLMFTNKIVADQASAKPGYGRPPRATHQTNIHTHGMHVPFTGNADNMAIMIDANETFHYQIPVIANHPAGLFWYHAHVHGLVTNQVGRGAAGMIYVSNAWTDNLARLGIRHRLMILQQAYFQADGRTLTADDSNHLDPNFSLSLINGQLLPNIQLRPGEPQVWSLLNASTSAFYVLRLEGHTFDVIADDGVPLPRPRLAQQTVMIPSGKRVEVVVRGAATPRSYELSYDEFFQGVDLWPRKTIGTVVVSGAAWTGASFPGVDTSTPADDLTKGNVSARRTITLAVNTNVPEGTFGRFTLNGHPWDPAINEWTSELNTTEEWIFDNQTEQDHPMHVHINPVQITERNGVKVPFDGYQDTWIVPRFSKVTVRTRFRDFTGPIVLMHCHILDHEDMGMMLRFTIAEKTK